jgi:hypothetical protein
MSECFHTDKEHFWDAVACKSCGAFMTDSGWGIASNRWFKGRAEAEFYKENGRLPEGSADDLENSIASLKEENERLRKALKGCKTHIAGFHLRDLDQAPAVLSEFNSELQRIHRLACAALEEKP